MRDPEPSGEVESKALLIQPTCMNCGGSDGWSQIEYTGDYESLDGFEVWFCCSACSAAGRPCETFHHISR